MTSMSRGVSRGWMPLPGDFLAHLQSQNARVGPPSTVLWRWLFCSTSTALLQRSTGNLIAAAVGIIYVGSRNRERCRQWQSPNSCVLSWRTQSFTLPPSIPSTHFSRFLWNSEVSNTVSGGQRALLHWEASHGEVPLADQQVGGCEHHKFLLFISVFNPRGKKQRVKPRPHTSPPQTKNGLLHLTPGSTVNSPHTDYLKINIGAQPFFQNQPQ